MYVLDKRRRAQDRRREQQQQEKEKEKESLCGAKTSEQEVGRLTTATATSI
jgi:hypothetical protein